MSSNPFLLEFIINLRWALHFFANDLEYSVNNQYQQLVTDAREVLTVLSTSYANLSTLGSVPLGALQLAKEGCVYLLVSEGILGSCPPTTHAFLLQNRGTKIYSSSASSSAPSHTSTDERLSQKGNPHQSHGKTGMPPSAHKRAPSEISEHHRRLNSLNTSVCTDLISSITDPAIFEQASPQNHRDASLTTDRLPAAGSTFSATNTSTNKRTDDANLLQKDDQAMFLLLRWLISEQILSTEELATTLEVDTSPTARIDSPPRRTHSRSHRVLGHHSSRRPRSKSFKEQSLMALKMAQLVPFYLGAHVLVTRSIYMAHCMRLLNVEDVVEHVKALRPECKSLEMPSGPSAGEPPSMEQAIVVWSTTSLHLLLCDLLNQQLQEKRRQKAAAVHLEAAITAVRHLHSKLEDSSPPMFYTHIQDGVVLLLLLHVYQKEIVSLSDIQFAASSEKAETTTRRSLANWRIIIDLAKQLGLWVGFYADELVHNYGGPLTLHLFAFVEKLFMVLATLAEEGARMSLDEEDNRTMLQKGDVGAMKGETQASWNHVTTLDSVARSAIMSSTRRRLQRRGGEHVEVSVDSRASHPSTMPSTVRSTSVNDRSAFPSPDKKESVAQQQPPSQHHPGPYEVSRASTAAVRTLDGSSYQLRPLVKRSDDGSLPNRSQEEENATNFHNKNNNNNNNNSDNNSWGASRVVQAKRKEKTKDPSLDGPSTRNLSVDTVATSVSALTAGSPPFGTISYPTRQEGDNLPPPYLHPSERLLAALAADSVDGSVRTPKPDTNLSAVSVTSTDAATMNQALGWSNVNVSKSTVVAGDSWLPEVELTESGEQKPGFHTPPCSSPPPPNEGDAVAPPPTICSTGKGNEEMINGNMHSTPGSVRQPPAELLRSAEDPSSAKKGTREATAPKEVSTATEKSNTADKDTNNNSSSNNGDDDEDDEDFVVQAVPERGNSFHTIALPNRGEDVSSSLEEGGKGKKKPSTPRVVVTSVTREAKSPSPLSPCGSLHTCSGPRTDSSISAPFRSKTQDIGKSKSQSVPEVAVTSLPQASSSPLSSVEIVRPVAPATYTTPVEQSVDEKMALFTSTPSSMPNRVVNTDTYDASVVVDPTPSQISYHDESNMSGYTGSVAASSVPAMSPLDYSAYRDSVRRELGDESYLSTATKHSASLDDLRQLSNLEAALAGDDKETLMKAVRQLQRINSQLVDRLQAREASGRLTSETVLVSPTRSLFRSGGDDIAWRPDAKGALRPLHVPAGQQRASRQSLTPLSRRSNLTAGLDMTVESAAPVHSPGGASYMTNMSAQLAETDVSSHLNSQMDKSYQ